MENNTIDIINKISVDNKEYEINSKYWNGLEVEEKEDALIIKTTDGDTISILGSGDITLVRDVIEITYEDIVNLCENSQLVPGQQYRITDFVTTTATTNTPSAGHQFDVIVTAVSDNTLNEDAKAALHDGDTYFANCDIDSWELKYCIDNNTNRFEWADTTNGKGVIYYMKDNGGNECQYDFKNIMFKNPSNADDTTWYYTFTNRDGNDLSLSVNLCYGNKIDGYYNGLQLKLNNIIFNCIDGRRQIVYNNVFGVNCYKNIFGYDCHDNNFGYGCYNNIFGNACYNNTFGDICYNNTFGEGCSYNTFVNNCYSNNFGKYCYYNTFGYTCHNNTFRIHCNYNNFGKACYSNTFGHGQYNTFGNGCYNITFSTLNGDENCYFKNLNFENECSYITIIEDTPVNTSSPVYVQNYVFMNSASGKSNSVQTYTVKRGLTHSTNVERDSYGQIKEYCKADTRNAYDIVNVDTQGATRYRIEIKPNTMYVIPELQELTITYGDIMENVAKEYVFQFASGSTATTLIMPLSTLWANGIAPVIKPRTIYQISVLNNLATLLEFPMP